MRLLRKLTLTGAAFIGLVLVSDVLFAEDSTERGLIEQFGDQLKNCLVARAYLGRVN